MAALNQSLIYLTIRKNEEISLIAGWIFLWQKLFVSNMSSETVSFSNLLEFESPKYSPNHYKILELLDTLMRSIEPIGGLRTQSSGTSSTEAAAAASPPVIASHTTTDPTSIQTLLLEENVVPSEVERRQVGALGSAVASRRTKYSFPPELQDTILNVRRYRIVKELGKGSFGKMFLAWDEHRE